MAYAQPPQFAHGDYPTAANLNIVADNLDALHDAIGDKTFRHYAVAYNLGNGFTFFHVWRWFFYAGSGVIISDPTGTNDNTTLPDVPDTEWGVYDLRQISWLYLGRHYDVQSAVWCIENRSSV